MAIRNAFQRLYWRFFNVMARIISLAFVAGAAGLLFGAAVDGSADRPLLIVLGIAIGVPALLMLRANAFRPDIDGYSSAFSASDRGRRSWWTGDPRHKEG